MKVKLLTLLLLAASLLHAQAPANDCDTLLLLSEQELRVKVDSIADDKVYYRPCDGVGEQQAMLLRMVTEIKGYEPETDSFSDNSERAGEEDLIAQEKEAVPKWLFSSKVKKRIKRKLEKGIKVKVTFIDTKEAKERNCTGRLKDINEEHVVINIQNKPLEIPKANVVKITPKKRFGVLGRIIGGLAIGFGLVSIIFLLGFLLVVLFLIGIFGRENVDSEPAEEETRRGCTWIFIAMLVGSLALILSIPKSIKNPFSDDWKVEKIIEEEERETQQVEPERTDSFEDFELP